MTISSDGKIIIVSSLISLFHGVLQFLLWGQLDRIDRPPSPLLSVAWFIFSFPLFSIVPRDYATRWFWYVFCLNSALWGGAVYAVYLARNLTMK